MPLDLPDYKSLSEQFLAPYSSQLAGMYDNMRTVDANQQLQKGQLDNMFSSQMNPLRVQGQQLQNQTAEAALPGVIANSSLLGDKAKLSSDTLDEQLNSLHSEYKGKLSTSELNHLTTTGQALGQAGGLLLGVPAEKRHAVAKRLLGNMWEQDYDQIPADKLPEKFQLLSRITNEMSSKFQNQEAALSSKEGIAAAKLDAQSRLQADRLAAQEALANKRISAQQEIASLKGKGAKKEELKNILAEYTRNYYNTADPDEQKIIQAKINAVGQMIQDIATASTNAKKEGELNLGATGGVAVNPPAQPFGFNPTIQPSGQEKPSPGPNTMTIDKLRSMYPGVPDDKLKEAFKKKFGIEVK